MKFPTNKKSLLIVSAFGFITVFALYASIWYIYDEAIKYFNEELDRRLIALTQTTATEIAQSLSEKETQQGSFFEQLRGRQRGGKLLLPVYSFEQELFFTQIRLQEIAKIQELQEITILDSSGKIIVSTNEDLITGEKSQFQIIYPNEIELARIGFPTHSDLYQSEDAFFKVYFAGIDVDEEVNFVLCAEVGLGTFAGFIEFKDKIFLIGGVCLFFIILLTLAQISVYFQISASEKQLIKNENLLAMGRMAAGIAHEIRNPLGIINSTAQRIKRKYGKEKEDPIFDFIPEEVDRLGKILTNYLEFSKNDENISFEKINLKALLRRVSNGVQEDFADFGIEVDFQSGGSEEFFIEGNSPQLQQVFLNFLLNSKDAFENEEGKIKIRLKKVKSKIEITFEDNGKGISQQVRKSIFEPFFTTKDTGSGLGLYLSKRIIENHNGTVEVDSDGKSWTKFKINF
ncbi:MAG: hypothetical protein DWQ06_08405 [Calditrichaeota bacterium]|nr:MAG: hypothetical protein DWQ06_08405 [Calditrichota bacterium]